MDRDRGEVLGDLGHEYVIAPLSRWADTPFMEIAAMNAADAFIAKGALIPVSFGEGEILIQEYHRSAKLAFIFQRKVAGHEMFFPYVFDLPPKAVAELIGSGRWIVPPRH